MIYLCNGISSTMMIDPRVKQINEPLTTYGFKDLIQKTEWESALGHRDLANCLSKLTGKQIKPNRLNLKVGYDDKIILVSLKKRLPEHPGYVEYKGNLTFSFVRFEKQNENEVRFKKERFHCYTMEKVEYVDRARRRRK